MPYKDPQRKREWEHRHHSQRLTRRRVLRRIEAAHNAVQPCVPEVGGAGAGVLWLPVLGGAALASYSPNLVMGAGVLTLFLAALYKKGWIWWIAGMAVLTIGVLFQWNHKTRRNEFYP